MKVKYYSHKCDKYLDMEKMHSYGDTIKELRLANAKTLKDVAEAVGTSVQNLSRWERGEVMPGIEFCVKLADYYGITIDELIGRNAGQS